VCAWQWRAAPKRISQQQVLQNIQPITLAVASAVLVATTSSQSALAESTVAATRADVGIINLNETSPQVTDVCWLDVALEGSSDVQRVEISLFGTIVPKTVENFKALCLNKQPGMGYVGTDFFRVISTFSVQGGNVGVPQGTPLSRIGRFGKSALNDGQGFAAENFRILHGYEEGGIVSMMKDLTNKGMQDSRFFISTSPDASWADDKYSAFGRVTKGLSFVKGLSIIPTTPPANYPNTRIRIVNAGCYQ